MKSSVLLKYSWLTGPCTLLVLMTLPLLVSAQHHPIALDPENPHYFLFHGHPLILITSGEHYGAVVNQDFDYITYLNTLHATGLNLTRTFSGAYVEPPDAFHITGNTLAPKPGRFLCPWARSNRPGYANGGNRFDLSTWDTAYFKRLRDFVSKAGKRNIVVELTFFCPFYDDAQWALSPMNQKNNINGVGAMDRNQVYRLTPENKLLVIQDALVKKIVSELKDYDNLIYEICNEPYFGNVDTAWQAHIASVISQAEEGFGTRHLISQNIANGSARITRPDPLVSVFNFHYASPPTAVSLNAHLMKVIGNNETGFRGNADSTYRKTGWQFILASGGLFNNLDYSFSAGHEDGSFRYPPTQPGGGSRALRRQLGYLKTFMDGFRFTRMQPDSTLITDGLPRGAEAYTLAEPGKQYAVYLWGGSAATLELWLPPGTYSVAWLNPVSGILRRKNKVRSRGTVSLKTPRYARDIALRLVRISSQKP